MAGKRQKKKSKNKNSRIKIYGFLILVLLTSLFVYTSIKPNINVEADYCYFYIPPNSTTSSVYDSLKAKDLLISNFTFWFAQKIFKFENPPEGLYKLKKNWGNLWLLHNLNKGNNRPFINYQIIGYKSRKNTIKSICKQTGVAYKELDNVLSDTTFLRKELGLNPESVYCIFLEGNYRMYKNQEPKEILNDIFSEYNLFWNDQRRKAAKKIKCSKEDVIKLASIVYAETKNEEEMPVIAGLYLNRLKKNMHLQADPTVVFARKSSNSRRVYFKHTNSLSPYNTYKHKGLPPGPIGAAPLVAIEAVLNHTKHDYLYFCAKADQSGCHHFSETFEEHKKNAMLYRKMLNNKKIK